MFQVGERVALRFSFRERHFGRNAYAYRRLHKKTGTIKEYYPASDHYSVGFDTAICFFYGSSSFLGMSLPPKNLKKI